MLDLEGLDHSLLTAEEHLRGFSSEGNESILASHHQGPMRLCL